MGSAFAPRFIDGWLAKLMILRARSQYRAFLRAAHHGARTQSRALNQILSRHADSAFGRSHHFSQIHSYEAFTRQVPIQTYEDMAPVIKRVMAGDRQALLGSQEQLLMFAVTSGTTSEPKYVPVTKQSLKHYRRGWHIFGIKALLDHPSGFTRGILQVASRADSSQSESGLPCGAISGLLASSQNRLVRRFYVVPPAACLIGDADARYYTIMRLAVPCDVGWLVTASPATPLKLASAAELHAERLIRDIRDGSLSPPGDMSEEVHDQITAGLKPDRQSARSLETLLDHYGALLPRHYWHLAFLANWTGGTLGLHLQDFPKYFGSTPVRDIGLLATEGRVSIPVADASAAGILDVQGAFFEFAPSDLGNGEATGKNERKVLRGHELTPGCEYRVIMTTWSGLYRYDLGDYVRVHGFEGQAPMVEFLHRGAHVSSITGEKLTEWQVVEAYRRATQKVPITAGRFVLAPMWNHPPRYRLFVEKDNFDHAHLATEMDQALSALNVEYKSKRDSNRLGSVIVYPVARGVLANMDKSRMQQRRFTCEQYKPQYLFTAPGQDEVLLQRTVPVG